MSVVTCCFVVKWHVVVRETERWEVCIAAVVLYSIRVELEGADDGVHVQSVTSRSSHALHHTQARLARFTTDYVLSVSSEIESIRNTE
jgi:hypothetical protein